MRPSNLCRISQKVTDLIRQPPEIVRLTEDAQALSAARRLFTYGKDKVRFLRAAPTIESIPNFGKSPEVRSSSITAP